MDHHTHKSSCGTSFVPRPASNIVLPACREDNFTFPGHVPWVATGGQEKGVASNSSKHYVGCCFNVIMSLTAIVNKIVKAITTIMLFIKQLINCCWTHPNATFKFQTSCMMCNIHYSAASCLSESKQAVVLIIISYLGGSHTITSKQEQANKSNQTRTSKQEQANQPQSSYCHDHLKFGAAYRAEQCWVTHLCM